MQDNKSKNYTKDTGTSEGCVSFDDFKQSLGLAANNYSDEEIERIRKTFDTFADQYFSIWIKKLNSPTTESKEKLYE